MARVSSEVEREVVRRFGLANASAVLAALAVLDDPPPDRAGWARTRARVQLAIVKLADGDATTVTSHIEGARRDWRNTLSAAGLENDGWPEVLQAAGYSVPP